MLLDNVTPAGARGRFPSAERGKAVRLRSDQIDVPSMRLHFARTRNANIIPHVRAARAAPGTGRFPLKSILLVASALVASHAAQAADLGVADLPRIHAEYKANQARWAREFLDKTFAATITLGGVSNVLGNDSFMVTFLETPSDWLPGVACNEAARAVRNPSTSFRIVLGRPYDLVAGVVELGRSMPSSASTRPLISVTRLATSLFSASSS
jgi:hypothetical protein